LKNSLLLGPSDDRGRWFWGIGLVIVTELLTVISRLFDTLNPRRHIMNNIVSVWEDLPDTDDTINEAEVWRQDLAELHEMAETLVNRHPRFALMVIDAWLTKQGHPFFDKKIDNTRPA
jgi:hypothetical protein